MKKVGRDIQVECDKGSVTLLYEIVGFEYWKGARAPGVWIHIIFLYPRYIQNQYSGGSKNFEK
jgi:hypothetical protein